MKIRIWNIEEMTGYKPITTYYQDFSIADNFGTEAVQETYDRAIKNYIDYKHLTELLMVLNWKIWEHHTLGGEKDEYAILYDKLWNEAAQNAVDTLKDEELSYYFRTID